MSASVMQGALVMMTQLRFLHLTVRLACSIVFLFHRWQMSSCLCIDVY